MKRLYSIAIAILLAAPVFAGEFLMHAGHKEKLGSLECSTCHVPVKDGSVVLKRPGHDQCMACHDDAFNKEVKQSICASCHTAFPPEGASDLLRYPSYKTRSVLFEFSHAKHMDAKARKDPHTGFRSDCTFCHKFEPKGIFATFPGHAECAACHSKASVKPLLSPAMETATCAGCHTPEETDNTGFSEKRRLVAKSVITGKYENIKFSHVEHFKLKDQYSLNCTSCHYAIPKSKSLADLTLPKMLDCVECHDTSKAIAANFRMSNCQTCHADGVPAGAVAPSSHTRNVKPEFHNESFRQHHEAEASAADAKCFVCHTNVTPALQAKNQCNSCHLVMKPVSHTARWKDDIHGKWAALDRTSCATCHASDSCVRCHNELPRSHLPLPLFKGGTHAVPATLDQRACMTCHTFQNTCAQCHTRKLSMVDAVHAHELKSAAD